MRSALALAVFLVLGGCVQPCETESMDFALADPGDAIAIRIVACPEDGSHVWANMKLAARGTPASPLTVLVDGIWLRREGPMAWKTTARDSIEVDCENGTIIELERVDAEPRVSFEGNLEVEMSTWVWAREKCSLEVSVQR
jgi:hypothetical protein